MTEIRYVIDKPGGLDVTVTIRGDFEKADTDEVLNAVVRTLRYEILRRASNARPE